MEFVTLPRTSCSSQEPQLDSAQRDRAHTADEKVLRERGKEANTLARNGEKEDKPWMDGWTDQCKKQTANTE